MVNMVNQTNKTGIIIQARRGSTRLPNKILLPLPFNSSFKIIDHIINRAKAIENVDEIIVATTMNAEDDLLCEIATNHQIKYFRGSENEILTRLHQAAVEHNLDTIIRLTGDNPFIDPIIFSSFIQEHNNSNADYTSSDDLPIGMNVEIFSKTGIEKAFKMANTKKEKESVNLIFKKNPVLFTFKKVKFKLITKLKNNIRLTIDYPSDFALASIIFESLYFKNNLFGLLEIEQLFTSYTWLPDINKREHQLS